MAYFVGLLVPLIASAQVVTIRLSPVLVRQAAIQSPLPVYPKTSIQHAHHGVAVVELLINGSGTTSDIKVLQSPDDAIADSVSAALKTWRFQPYTFQGRPTAIRSRFIFYFDLDGSGPHVTDAMRSSF